MTAETKAKPVSSLKAMAEGKIEGIQKATYFKVEPYRVATYLKVEPYRVAKALLEAHAQCVIPDVDDEL